MGGGGGGRQQEQRTSCPKGAARPRNIAPRHLQRWGSGGRSPPENSGWISHPKGVKKSNRGATALDPAEPYVQVGSPAVRSDLQGRTRRKRVLVQQHGGIRLPFYRLRDLWAAPTRLAMRVYHSIREGLQAPVRTVQPSPSSARMIRASQLVGLLRVERSLRVQELAREGEAPLSFRYALALVHVEELDVSDCAVRDAGDRSRRPVPAGVRSRHEHGDVERHDGIAVYRAVPVALRAEAASTAPGRSRRAPRVPGRS